MKRNMIYADIREHRGEATYALKLVQEFVSKLHEPTLAWVVLDSQAGALPPGANVEVVAKSKTTWLERLGKQIIASPQSERDLTSYLVMTYDPSVVSEVKKLQSLGLNIMYRWFATLYPRKVAGVAVKLHEPLQGTPEEATQLQTQTSEIPSSHTNVGALPTEPTSNRPATRATQFEAALTVERVGGLPRSRELLYRTLSEVTNSSTYIPLLCDELLEIALTRAVEIASEEDYTDEARWDVAGTNVINLMRKADVLLINENGVAISDRKIGRHGQRVKQLREDFTLYCDAFLVEKIIERCGPLHYEEDIYHLGLVLFRGGKAQPLSASELKRKADAVLVFLEQAGRIELTENMIIRLKQFKATTK